ncbi:Ycf48-like protein [Halomicronema hongdechloris C2206]|uniref:Photosystem II assembly lipoprotein Ycf48 n=1 Tax=Halomicronema hongdechloris C2206 TaxID=1641165 RepID=A0A1Z3HPM0_9CYAN|nr:photosynthesis system II assembly factor Ycf48 [Halomicronema hongdechloris]ASC72238.1 Ycf48-like protein [Halomicronema hongdechloris C2206]
MRALVTRLKQGLALVAIALFAASCSNYLLPNLEENPWDILSLPTDATFNDIAFTDTDPNHGWLVGTGNTLMETQDGGNTWAPKTLDLDQKYRLTSVSFSGTEGWVTGQPSLLLHTTDGGASWERIPLSEKLPGKPFLITALGRQSAEMATDVGAIYRTEDNGETWQALVEGAVGVVRNMNRSADGHYVAVSSRGNFYSTWQPGEREWHPHNRQNSRRLQNMGFDRDGHLWLLARGGQIQFAESGGVEDFEDPINPELVTSWGLLDIAYRTPDELWVSGGSGNLLCSFDGGKTWYRDESVEDVPSNLYRIVFTDANRGFVLGQRGYLLKYADTTETA